MTATQGRIVGIDSNILIYAFASPGLPSDQDLMERAGWLLDALFDQKATVCVSVVSIAEYLVKIPLSQHSQMIRKLESRFTIAPFNLRAASVAADLVAKSKNNAHVTRRDGDRPCLMADTKIAASLFAAGIRELYANDSRILDLAKISGLSVQGLLLQRTD